MKKRISSVLVSITLSLVVISFLWLRLVNVKAAPPVNKSLQGTITISGAWAIYPTVVALASAFQKKHPGVKINVSAGGAGKGAADAISGLVNIGMVSRDPDPAEIKKGIIPIYVLHDAVFPVVSSNNPALKILLKKGIKKKIFIAIYITGSITKWDNVIGQKINKPIHLFTRSDSCGAAATWAKYLGNKKQEDLRGVGVYGDPGLLETAKKDILGIGYNNFSYIFTRQGTIVGGAQIIPIDANENGIADAGEVIKNKAQAVKAIETAKYPIRRKNYFFVKKGKVNLLVKEFIKFSLSDEGTKIVNQVGASLPLPKAERVKVLSNVAKY